VAIPSNMIDIYNLHHSIKRPQSSGICEFTADVDRIRITSAADTSYDAFVTQTQYRLCTEQYV